MSGKTDDNQLLVATRLNEHNGGKYHTLSLSKHFQNAIEKS